MAPPPTAATEIVQLLPAPALNAAACAGVTPGENGKRVQSMTMEMTAMDIRRQGKYPARVIRITPTGEKYTPIW